MAGPVEDSYRSRDAPRPWRRWFAFLGGGIAWTLHLLSIYAIGEFGCTSGFDETMWLGVSAVAWLLIGASAILLGVATAAVVIGYRDAGGRWNDSDEPPEDAQEILSQFGWVLSALFMLVILIESVPIFFYLDGC